MSRNGLGIYYLPAGNPVVNGTTISSATMNATLSDIAAALTQSVSTDGQSPFTNKIQLYAGSTISASPSYADFGNGIATLDWVISKAVTTVNTNVVNLSWDGRFRMVANRASIGTMALVELDNNFQSTQSFAGRLYANGGITTGTNIINDIYGDTRINSGGTANGAPIFSLRNTDNGYRMFMRCGPSGMDWVNNSFTAVVASLTDAGAFSANSITQTSDERLKTNWKSVPDGLIDKMATVLSGSYDLKAGSTNLIGVSAQELQAVMPQAIANDEQGYLSVNYGAASLVSVIELCKEVVLLRARLAALEAK